MAGVSVDSGGKGGRRSMDSEINMIPMIDLLMVTISFLLITAVWTHMSRVEANAQVPGTDTPPCEGAECAPPRVLHVEMRDPAKFALFWSEGGREIARTEIPRTDVMDTYGKAKFVHFPGLEAEIAKEWGQWGKHRDASDRELDRLVLHTDDAASYAQVIGAIDAVHGVHRPIVVGKKTSTTSAFNVTFASK
jgi:biopolymer transport protein ExbD